MRILLAVHQFLPEFRAGTETLTLRSGQELQRRGHQVWVLTASGEAAQVPRLERFEQGGLPVIRLHLPDPPAALRGGLSLTFRRPELQPLFTQILDEVQPELAHLFHLRRLTLTLVEECARKRIPVVATLTDYWFACLTGQLQFPDALPCPGPDADSANCLRHAASKTHPAFLRLPCRLWPLLASRKIPWGLNRVGTSIRQLQERPAIMRESLGRFERVLVPSQVMADTFASLGFPTARLRVCPYGIDGRGLERQPRRQAWPGPEARPLELGFIGTLIESKGAHVVLDAVRKLGKEAPLRLRVYGNPSEHPGYSRNLHRQAADMGGVRFEGVFAPEEIHDVLTTLDLLVIPSLWRENSPLILLQGLASGVPILASDVAGMADVLQAGTNGELFAPGDSEALASWLSHFLTEPNALANLQNRGGQPRTLADYADQLEAEYWSVLPV